MINKVGIIGSGTMGSGIAQVAATSGCKVKLYDTNQAALEKAKSALEKILNRLIEKGHIDKTEKNITKENKYSLITNTLYNNTQVYILTRCIVI